MARKYFTLVVVLMLLSTLAFGQRQDGKQGLGQRNPFFQGDANCFPNCSMDWFIGFQQRMDRAEFETLWNNPVMKQQLDQQWAEWIESQRVPHGTYDEDGRPVLTTRAAIMGGTAAIDAISDRAEGLAANASRVIIDLIGNAMGVGNPFCGAMCAMKGPSSSSPYEPSDSFRRARDKFYTVQQGPLGDQNGTHFLLELNRMVERGTARWSANVTLTTSLRNAASDAFIEWTESGETIQNILHEDPQLRGYFYQVSMHDNGEQKWVTGVVEKWAGKHAGRGLRYNKPLW
jgi:hypothetical protein